MISASVDGTARLWDVNSGQNSATLAYHETKVYDAVVNDAMTQAVTVSSDKKIAVWDLRNTN
jgi:WD40 repeat protein